MMFKISCVLPVLASLAAVSQGFSRILVSPESSAVGAGSTILLPCVAYSYSSNRAASSQLQLSLTWRRGATLLQNSSRIVVQEEVRVSSGNGIAEVVIVKSVLELCDVAAGDSGEYSCTANTEGEEEDAATFQVHVLTSPAMVVVGSTNEDLSTNSSAYLSCVAFSLPPPEVSWLHNGRTLTNGTHSAMIHNDIILRGQLVFVRSTLSLCNVQGEHIGEYTCVASNGMTSSDHTFTITVPSPTAFHSGPKRDNILIHGQSRNYSCDFTGYPFPIITWTRSTSKNPITTVGRFTVHTFQVSINGVYLTRSILEIQSAMENLNGMFNCSGNNNLTTGQTRFHTFMIKVVIPPQIILAPVRYSHMVVTPTQLQTIFVTCVAIGSPRPTLEWRNSHLKLKNSTNVSITEKVEIRGGREFVRSQLEICGPENLPESDYSCIASNHYGAANSSVFHICTIDKVELLVVPGDQIIGKGEDILVPCVSVSIGADVSTTLTWTRRKPGSQGSRGDAEILTNTTDRVTIFHSREERASGAVIMKSVLHLGCVEFEDKGKYSCHVASTAANKTVEFLVDVKVTSNTVGVGPKATVDSFSHADYVGALITNVLLLVVTAVHLAFRKLRNSNIGIPLVNLCSALVALNFSYIASLVSAFSPGTRDEGCGFLAALFHYVFLVASFAFALLVTFILTDRDVWTVKKKTLFYIATFMANWGLPLLIVVTAAAPDVSNYSNGFMTFCGPKGHALWFGLASPVTLVHLVTITSLLLLNFLSDKIHRYVKQREVLGVCVTLVLFNVIWGIGLTSSALTSDNSQKLTLQNIFTIASAVQGLEIGFFFCILSKKVREEFIKLVTRKTSPKSTSIPPNLDKVETGMGLREDSITTLGDYPDSAHVPLQRKLSGVSLSSLSPASESGQNYPAHFRFPLDPIPEDQS